MGSLWNTGSKSAKFLFFFFKKTLLFDWQFRKLRLAHRQYLPAKWMNGVGISWFGAQFHKDFFDVAVILRNVD